MSSSGADAASSFLVMHKKICCTIDDLMLNNDDELLDIINIEFGNVIENHIVENEENDNIKTQIVAIAPINISKIIALSALLS
ncbi:hypothetical protein PUN28_008218 [Cardiocondyla obscurior]|uniref:Uncharacterized protein n=1 Tax=Cardiocondyla obscurior TaxID=286306 RepID=A0AAW2G1X2_9HYME